MESFFSFSCSVEIRWHSCVRIRCAPFSQHFDHFPVQDSEDASIEKFKIQHRTLSDAQWDFWHKSNCKSSRKTYERYLFCSRMGIGYGPHWTRIQNFPCTLMGTIMLPFNLHYTNDNNNNNKNEWSHEIKTFLFYFVSNDARGNGWSTSLIELQIYHRISLSIKMPFACFIFELFIWTHRFTNEMNEYYEWKES